MEPLGQCIEPAERGGRYTDGTRGPQRRDRRGGSLSQIVQCAALGQGRTHCLLDAPDRLLRQSRSVIAIAEMGRVASPFTRTLRACFPLRRIARVSDGVEVRLLLVAQGNIEALEGG